MTPQALDQATNRRIRSLMGSASNAARIVRKATLTAKAKRQRLDTEAQQRRQEQQAREQRLTQILEKAARGLAAIIELGRTSEIRNLAAARASIKLSTPLYEQGDDHTLVFVRFLKDAVIIGIYANVYACGQRCGGPPNYADCELVRCYPLKAAGEIDTTFLRMLFWADLHTEWGQHEFDEEAIKLARKRSNWKAVGDWHLDSFERLDLQELDEKDADVTWRDAGVDANRVLLRILVDCCDPANLKRHLERSLSDLQ